MLGLSSRSGYVNLPSSSGDKSESEARSCSSSGSSSGGHSLSSDESSPMLKTSVTAPRYSGTDDPVPSPKLPLLNIDGVGVMSVFNDDMDERGRRVITGFRPSGAIGRVTLDTEESRLAQQDSEKYFLTPQDRRRSVFAPSFFSLFSDRNKQSPDSVRALRALLCCTVEQQARLPLFESASERYTEIVGSAISAKILEDGNGSELMKTKKMIIDLAVRYRYLDKVLFPHVVISNLNFAGLDLRGESPRNS